MHANSNSTLPSLASIFAGRYPLKHGYDRFSYLLAGGSRAGDLDQVLKSEGYGTAAVVGIEARVSVVRFAQAKPAAAGGARWRQAGLRGEVSPE